ncbi:hypothetical protein CTAYLR_000307 [Chrysophaeum taylorii]|uniref:Uncharacterized protein n=1 Tax=Chrysophaeum taylorii TaxID=2483200 RepID=A0AAD7XPL0_9STRA|nr:hypothetical protein CTAYLR_000307 [Chrysophaeum taylorii]
MSSDDDKVARYARLWGCAQVLEWWFGNLAARRPYDVIQLSLVGAAIAAPTSKGLVCAALLARVGNLFTRLPCAFDAEVLSSLSDATVFLAIVTQRVRSLPETTRWQLATFYFAAGFLKVNTSFLEPTTSCASTYFIQILDVLALPTLAPFAFRLAGLATIALECGIGVSFAVSPRLAVFLAVSLHAGIAITPPPNNISGFGVICAVRCFWVLGGPPRLSPGLLAGAAAAAAVLGGLTSTLHGIPSPQIPFVPPLDYPAVVFGALAFLCLATKPEPGERDSTLLALGVAGVALWFSNLRMSGGTNHLLGLPTGLLQQWYADDKTSVFSGGVLRVDASNSTLLNALHPAELTPILADGARRLLRENGNSGRFWNPAVASIIGHNLIPNPSFDLRYTLPAYELFRALRLTSEPLDLTFSKLPGAVGDEAWRRGDRGIQRTVNLQFSPRFPAVVNCTVLSASRPCDDDDLFFQDFIDAPPTLLNQLGRALLSWNSYVILPREGPTNSLAPDELPCYGS